MLECAQYMQIWNLEHSTSNKNVSKEYFRKILLFLSIIRCANQMILQIMVDCDHPVQRTTIFQIKHTLKKFFYLFFTVLDLCYWTQNFCSCGKWKLLSCCMAWALGLCASAAAALWPSSCSSQARGCGLSSCGTPAELPCSMWDLLGPGIEVVSSTLAGRFLTTGPPGILRHALKRQPLTGLMYVIKITLS